MIALLGGRGAKEATKKAAPQGPTFELAGAVISDKKADELVKAVESLADEIAENTAACRVAAANAKEAADAMDVLTREIIRGK